MKSTILKSCVLVLVSFAFSPKTIPLVAQSPASGESVRLPADEVKQPPLCEADMIDATLAFGNHPVGEQTISLYFLNKGATACRLKDPPNPSFAVDGHSMNVASCLLCGSDNKTLPMWNRRPENEVVLAPGATTAIDVNWASTGDSCQWADWASIFFNWTEGNDFRQFASFLFVPSDWPMRICSPVRSFGYRAVPDSSSSERVKDAAIRVSVLQQTVYSDERATLRIEVASPAQSGDKPVGCASLYTVRRDGPLQTRLDSLDPIGSSRVNSYTPEQIKEDRERAWPQWKRDFRRSCDVTGGTTTADADIQANVLATVTHIEWRTAPAAATEPVFLSTATKFNVLDVDSLPFNWGEAVKGIRAGLSVDKETFTAGERIPLHVRWENVNGSDSLGQGECNEPEPDVEIQDSQHRVLKTIPSYPNCMGHGWGPFEIAKGKPQHIFREFATASAPVPPYVTPAAAILPGPGVYFLVSVWSPRLLEKSNASVPGRIGSGTMGAVYATARSAPVRIEIVPRGNP